MADMADNDPVQIAALQQEPPLKEIPIPPHVGIGSPYQSSYYDPSSDADLGPYKKLPRGGPVDLHTGRKTGDYPDSPPFRQV